MATCLSVKVSAGAAGVRHILAGSDVQQYLENAWRLRPRQRLDSTGKIEPLAEQRAHVHLSAFQSLDGAIERAAA